MHTAHAILGQHDVHDTQEGAGGRSNDRLYGQRLEAGRQIGLQSRESLVLCDLRP